LLLSKLFAGLPPEARVDHRSIRGIAYDSRRVEPGFLFVAIKGFKTDGHLFIDDAVRRGAVAVVVQEDVAVPEGVAKVLVDDTRRVLPILSDRFFDYPARGRDGHKRKDYDNQLNRKNLPFARNENGPYRYHPQPDRRPVAAG